MRGTAALAESSTFVLKLKKKFFFRYGTRLFKVEAPVTKRHYDQQYIVEKSCFVAWDRVSGGGGEGLTLCGSVNATHGTGPSCEALSGSAPVSSAATSTSTPSQASPGECHQDV